jgi:hypothetical protein
MDKDIICRLRDLAKQVRDIADDPLQSEYEKLWTAVNDKKMIHPVALVKDYGLNLIEYGEELSLIIEDKELRYYEAHLLAQIYQWKHLRCHSVTEKQILCDAVIEETDWGVPESTMYHTSEFWRWRSKSEAKHYPSVFRDEGDIENIVVPEIHHDQEATQKKVDRLNEIFDGILPVYPRGHSDIRFKAWDDLFKALGLQEGMMNLALKPDFMMALVNKYIDVFSKHVENLEKLGLINTNNSSALIGYGGYGFTSLLPHRPKEGVMGAALKDTWSSASDQIFTSVSPEMSDEFAFIPEQRYAEKFGLMYYGCCEKLDHKVDLLFKWPNIHKISCSPYSDREAFFEKIGNRAVISFKPNSVLLADIGWDIKPCKEELMDVCRLARKYNCSVECIMKTIISLGNNPKRLWEWSEMAADVLNNY